MQTGALIVAAGMSSRMGAFKPMVNIGSISIAQRIVATFQQAGIRKIVMVTGYNAAALERHLAGSGVIFLRNEQYETTQMFDSVKIGLRYLQDKCDRVLFTPVDMPLFTARTVQTLLEAEGDVVRPVCEGRAGHPIGIASSLLPDILADSGERGLRGALRRCGTDFVNVAVDDPGTIQDADTPEDCSALVSYHNSQLVRPVVQVALSREKTFLDSRVAMLLSLVDETRSVRAAGQRMQLSYSSCWNLIRTLEEQLEYPLIERTQGGPTGSMSVLTEQGRLLLDRYTAYEQKLKEVAGSLYGEYFGELFPTQWKKERVI